MNSSFRNIMRSLFNKGLSETTVYSVTTEWTIFLTLVKITELPQKLKAPQG